MNKRGIFAIAGVAAVLLITIGCFLGLVGKNNDQNWQFIQSVGGSTDIRDNGGYYVKWFASVWDWPKTHINDWGQIQDEDTGVLKGDKIRVTFNDGGWAYMNGLIQYTLPVETELRKILHRKFGGNIQNLDRAVEAHLINCLKVAGPAMSGSEHQSARKGEFYNLVFSQLVDGLFQTRKVARVSQDETDANGDPITVYVTEIVRDADGNPIIAEASPLGHYGIQVDQFSIKSTKYDDDTLEQFRTKKQSMLAAESSKANREAQVQERLMIEEQKLKEKAEVEGEALKTKAVAVIAAQQKVEVAEAAKREADEQRMKAVMDARREKEVAGELLEAEKLRAEAVRVAAAAEEERIQKAGAITEHDRVLAEIAKERDIGVAEKLANVRTPNTIIGGGGEGGSGNVMGQLINMFLLKNLGILKNAPGDGKVVPTK